MIQQAVDEWNSSVAVEKAVMDEDKSARLLTRLKKPDNMIDVVVDTDTYNEIDDQYALAYLINSDEKLNLQAIYAAPFTTYRSTGPADGMEKSYLEILKLLDLMDRRDISGNVYRGSTAYLKNESTPIVSDAANDLASRAMKYTQKNQLYVVAIGAITNIASAILINPDIVNRIVVIWLGGNALNWPQNNEFNMTQDIAAARIVYGSGVPLVQLPCMGVVSAFSASGPELIHHLKGKNKLCDYLLDITITEAHACGGTDTWSRPIWDVTAVAWLLDDNFMYDTIKKIPIPGYDDQYAFSENRHFYKYVYHINRDDLFADLFKKLAK